MDFRSLKWFFLSIIAISTLFTVSSSFLLGFQNQQLFTSGSANDILVISQPKITPAQSQLPLFWIEDIHQLPGISVISPETVDIVIDHTTGQTPYFRGVTDNFINITSNFTMLQGHFFSSTQNTTKTEIVVGKNYANLFHIKVGDTLVLQSRPRTAILDVTVAGIFSSHTIADNGLLGPLWVGRLFGGLPDNLVNIIRIKFDPSVYTKTQLQNIILNNHNITIKVTNPFKYAADISKSSVVLYNRFKEKINQSMVNSQHEVNFIVPFGQYYIEVVNSNISSSNFESLFVKQNETFQAILGTQYASLSAQFSISHEVKSNASINIDNIDTNKVYNYTTNTKGAINAYIPLGRLQITFKWKHYENSTMINHQANQSLTINFNYAITINIVDGASNNSLTNKQIIITNVQTNQAIVANSNNQGEVVALVQPDTPYSITSTDQIYARTVSLSSFNTSTFDLFVGTVPVTIHVQDIDTGNVANYPITVTIYNQTTSKTTIKNVVTDAKGYFQIMAKAGTIITLSAVYGLSNQSFAKRFIVSNQALQNFYLGKQEFFLTINNSNIPAKALFPVPVVIKNLNSLGTTNITVTSNQSLRVFLQYGTYAIFSTKTSFPFYDEFTFNETSTTKFQVNYNTFTLQLTFHTKNGTLFTGSFTLYQKFDSGFKSFQTQTDSTITAHVADGLYKIVLTNTQYTFDKTITIQNSNYQRAFTVSEKAPVITPLNFQNQSIINSSIQLFVSSQNSQTVQYKWNVNDYQPYNSQNGIPVITNQGLATLTILSTNFDNVSTKKEYSITIDNTGPIATILNHQGNNSWINYNLLPFIPVFSFSKTPKFVSYTWNTINNITTSSPTAIPDVQGPNRLKVVVEDYAGNSNTFYYVFTLDSIKPYLKNSNPVNNTITNATNVNVTISEPLKLFQYQWNGNAPTTGNLTNNTFSIQVPPQNGLNYNLTLYMTDLFGNYNTTTLRFPIMDHIYPNFIFNSSLTNAVFNQINSSIIPCSVNNTINNANTTLRYNWNTSSSWQHFTVQNNVTYEINVPYINGPLALKIQILEEYNHTFIDVFSQTYYFTGNFTLPQVNATLNGSLGPNQAISILFPSNYLNWTLNWNTGGTLFGNTSTTSINAPTELGNNTLHFKLFNNISATYQTISYYFTIKNERPYISNINDTYLSALNNYTLVFPSYVQSWNYSWDNQTYYYGTTTTTKLNISSSFSGLKYLYINYKTNYGNYSSFSEKYTIDSNIPQIYLAKTYNFSQKAGFIPGITFSENTSKIIRIFYLWSGLGNSTILYGMPKYPDNTYTNLTIFVEDLANNWNSTTFSFIQDNSIALQLNPINGTTLLSDNYAVHIGDVLVFETNKPPSLVTCSWNGQNSDNCSLTSLSITWSIPANISQGKNTFTIWVYDNLGNVNATTLYLYYDTIAPILTYSTLQNNTIINAGFILKYNFNENVPTSDSFYVWDSFGNSTGYPVINTSLFGFHTLNWWFSDAQHNWNHYTFHVFIDTILPSFQITGNYSSTLILANSSIQVIPFDSSNVPLTITAHWNNETDQVFDTTSNSGVSINLPNSLGTETLYVTISDSYNNQVTRNVSFIIKPRLTIGILDNNSKPINNITLSLTNIVNHSIVFSAQANNLSLIVEPANYSLSIIFPTYTITSTFNLLSSSVTKLIYLKNITFIFNHDNSSTKNSGTIQWYDNSLKSSVITVNNSYVAFVPLDDTYFSAHLNNRFLDRLLNPSQNINSINFTTQLSVLELSVKSALHGFPIQNAIITSDQNVIGSTNSSGLFTGSLTSGTHLINVQYATFKYNFSIQIFEKQDYIINLPVTANISISIKNQDNSPAGDILVSLYTSTNVFMGSKITDFNGLATWNLVSWGTYKIEINLNSTNIISNITISSLSDQKGNIFTFSLPQTNTLLSAVGNNLGKWSFNRNYEVVAPNQLSDQSLANLGFSIIFTTLFLIVLLMTITGLVSVLHQPIYKLRNIIRDLRRIGASENQILSIVSFQFTLYSIVLALLGYVFGFLLILLWPNIQQFPIAGMIIKPQTTNVLIPLTIIVSFCVITAIFTYNYTKKEYFSKEKSKQ